MIKINHLSSHVTRTLTSPHVSDPPYQKRPLITVLAGATQIHTCIPVLRQCRTSCRCYLRCKVHTQCTGLKAVCYRVRMLVTHVVTCPLVRDNDHNLSFLWKVLVYLTPMSRCTKDITRVEGLDHCILHTRVQLNYYLSFEHFLLVATAWETCS